MVAAARVAGTIDILDSLQGEMLCSLPGPEASSGSRNAGANRVAGAPLIAGLTFRHTEDDTG